MTRPRFPVRARYPLFIARRFVRARRQGFLSLISLLSALAFLVGVMSLIVALALMTGFQEDVIGRIVGSNAHLLVQPPGGKSELPDPPRVLERVRNLPDVVAATPVVHGYGGIVGPSSLVQWTMLTGIEPAEYGKVTDIARHMTSGQLVRIAEPTRSGRPGIVLGNELARRLGAIPGDQVRLLIPRVRRGGPGPSVLQPVFEVVGLFVTGFTEYDTSWSFIPLRSAGESLDAAGAVHEVAARIRDTDALQETRERVQRALGPDVSVVDVVSSNRAFFSALRLEKLLMFLAVALIVGVAALGVVSTLVLTVTQKYREIGVLVALGATPRGILQVFLLQGLAMGLLGTLGGTVAGVGIAHVLDRFRLIKLDPDVYYLDHLPFSIRAGDLGLVVGVAVLVAVGATLYPALRAARLDPVEALHRD